jgi:hypothetical protein
MIENGLEQMGAGFAAAAVIILAWLVYDAIFGD